LVPIHHGDELRQMRIYVQDQDGRGEDKDDSDDSTRFIVEVELSQTGPLQLDGLYRRKLFNLIVRTREALADNVRRDITEIFQNSVSAAGLGGEIAFQTSLAFPTGTVGDTGGDGIGLTV
jgi:hypothetical protein